MTITFTDDPTIAISLDEARRRFAPPSWIVAFPQEDTPPAAVTEDDLVSSEWDCLRYALYLHRMAGSLAETMATGSSQPAVMAAAVSRAQTCRAEGDKYFRRDMGRCPITGDRLFHWLQQTKSIIRYAEAHQIGMPGNIISRRMREVGQELQHVFQLLLQGAKQYPSVGWLSAEERLATLECLDVMLSPEFLRDQKQLAVSDTQRAQLETRSQSLPGPGEKTTRSVSSNTCPSHSLRTRYTGYYAVAKRLVAEK